ncbi:toxin [Pelomonas sp. SE-A7]|uniref:toxin n=1 Tax=Pelomonas sp. SE-A7 TaxID=3054953 RepID=UPI00259CE1A4|nr:toxin [Pelomonas sp. SE-A7]MDM4768264.1 toxin [Pelomonas sp. SE-A7]
MKRRRAPGLDVLLKGAVQAAGRPAAFVLAGHNGSGKSTLWYDRLVNGLQMPLINADRLTTSILPERGEEGLPAWAQRLRDEDGRWHELSQQGVKAFKRLVMAKQIPFAFETVFSHWVDKGDGTYESKADDIVELQEAGYFVVLLFVGLATAGLSTARVQTRRQQGGHAVPVEKLVSRFPRTQLAIRHAAPLADMAIFFDNSRKPEEAFSLVRVQQKDKVLFDCRNEEYDVPDDLKNVAMTWLPKVSGDWPAA